ncbi:MAG: translesion error-prone DNA polymerase V autoproteolytic subunit [Cycloclasticus sp.]|nr:translesion error-prone DNA polymerase V autoproteolytic subunit [Cycloclasticus sp.]
MAKETSKRGGSRPGAGRKKGSSVYGEPTKAVRVPESLLATVTQLLAYKKQQLDSNHTDHPNVFLPDFDSPVPSIPFYGASVAAGFPSPADDYVEKRLDLNELLINKPAATFFVRAEGESMLGAGIHPGDVLVVDRSVHAGVGKIIVCALDGELTVKRLRSKEGKLVLSPENPNYQDIPLKEEVDMVIWGVVTSVIHNV